MPNKRQPREQKPKRGDSDFTEVDTGYGGSHGYASGLQGPSGPGDAPAKEPPRVRK